MIRSIHLTARVLFACTALATPALAALGGGEVRMSGSGDNMVLERIGPAPSQAGRRTMFAGNAGGGPEMLTLEAGPAAEPGRDVMLQGSRENAEVVDATPQPRG